MYCTYTMWTKIIISLVYMSTKQSDIPNSPPIPVLLGNHRNSLPGPWIYVSWHHMHSMAKEFWLSPTSDAPTERTPGMKQPKKIWRKSTNKIWRNSRHITINNTENNKYTAYASSDPVWRYRLPSITLYFPAAILRDQGSKHTTLKPGWSVMHGGAVPTSLRTSSVLRAAIHCSISVQHLVS